VLFAALGPVLVNVLMVEQQRRSIFLSTAVASLGYFAALAMFFVAGRLTGITVAFSLVFSALLRCAYRLIVIRKYAAADWLY
jgi:hypothetical protein